VLATRSLSAQGDLLVPVQVFKSAPESAAAFAIERQTLDCNDVRGCDPSLMKAERLVLAANDGAPASDASGPLAKLRALATSDETEDEPAKPQTRNAFRFRAYWFVLAQTEGEETCIAPIPGFHLDTALRTLQITCTAFDEINGNIQGFARHREIAVSPLAALPYKTAFHEIAHVVLGHTTSEKLVDGEHTPRHLREVEAESVAFICCETLGLDGAEFCRGYIQHWLKTEKEISNHNAAHIFAAATSILKAGTPATGSH